jgi:hypothetical protein
MKTPQQKAAAVVRSQIVATASSMLSDILIVWSYYND